MQLPEASQAWNEPVGCEGRECGDRQNRLDHLLNACECIPQCLEGLRHGRSELPPFRRQRYLTGQADEQRRSDPILQDLDLIAHGGLRHAELLGSAGKALMASRRLEDSDGTHRGKF